MEVVLWVSQASEAGDALRIAMVVVEVVAEIDQLADSLVNAQTRPVMPAPAPVPVVVPAPPSPPVIKQNPVPPRKPGYGGMIGFLRGGSGRTGLLSTLY
ncbi:hypothetical protein EB796_015538 [Bugula neritina]|uniref:Uncharacterized protein n=1 Tax=Bugula neritina TaxID=10212 RepID=A0A7J7JIK7_BUGNE|nr:hypothetical protein EB796_015538 [Bugula neritina]